jgi:deoxycytidylate deaminase
MPKVHKFLKLAQEISRQSTAIQQKMAAIVVKSGKIVSVGINRNMSHAETRALRPHIDYRGADLYVSRWNGRISRPCPECQMKAIQAGIKRCYYIGLDGSIVVERFGLYARSVD